MIQVPLTNGQFAIVDDEDYPLVAGRTWIALKRSFTTYAITHVRDDGEKKTVSMHRIVIGAKSGQQVDHRDLNGLNNSRSNLRFATSSQNGANRQVFKGRRFKGVTFAKQQKNKPWHARIKVEGRIIQCGLYETAERAAAAYNEAAIKYFGAFARLNPLPSRD